MSRERKRRIHDHRIAKAGMSLIGEAASRASSWRRDQQACDCPNDGMTWGAWPPGED